jgi:anthranilate synthase/aminodeoxychorismate synthase-like glutamine amidotransferase
MIILVDNYDSFTYNLYQLLGEIGEKVVVFRNDEVNKKIVQELLPDAIVISPGPCTPDQAGNSMEIIDLFLGKIPILGVCLGHQCIVQVFGGKIIKATKPVHGKKTKIFHGNSGLFENLEKNFYVVRYHSLIAEKETLPPTLSISSWTEDGVIMGVENVEKKIFGIQFHPESIDTEFGKNILLNFRNHINE